MKPITVYHEVEPGEGASGGMGGRPCDEINTWNIQLAAIPTWCREPGASNRACRGTAMTLLKVHEICNVPYFPTPWPFVLDFEFPSGGPSFQLRIGIQQ